ncbi:dihydroorotate oxidase [Pseudohyphozyma bogoriensis]|nr:dihydroorotate oxidase [Pseudohyphozyma bogoriensis]
MLRASLRSRSALRRPYSTVPPSPPPPPAPVAAPPRPSSSSGGFRSALYSTAFLLGTGAFLYYAHDSRAGVYRWVVMPAFAYATKDDPEGAHLLAVKVMASGFGPVDRGVNDDNLALEVFGKKYSSPIGIAAGFDKHAEAIDGLFNVGFDYVEIGSVTPEPQPGNPQPRIFRVPSSKSLVNRYGFNSEGHSAVLERLRSRIASFVSYHASSLPPSTFPAPPANAHPDHSVVVDLLSSPAGQGATITDQLGLPRSLRPGKVFAVNLGKNKASDPDSIDDFVNGVTTLGPYADTLVINVSSPNTPGLRGLQRKGMLDELLEGVVAARNALPGAIKPPVLVKVAPDLDQAQIEDIAHAVLSSGIDGIIVSNTTISRPPSAGTSDVLKEAGGLSGPPVKALALKAITAMHEATEGKIPLVGCGGIANGQDAVDFAKAGATLVQTYTAMVYEGFGLPRKLKDEVAEILRKEGKTWKEIVGTGIPKKVVAPPATEEVDPIIAVKKEGPPPTEEDFNTSLEEVKGELEALLAELAAAEKPIEKDTLEPVIQALAPPPASPSTPSPPAPTSAPEPAPVIPETTPIDLSPIAIPAPALLDENAIKELLDPAKAQVESGSVKEASVEEKPKEEKKWV